MQEIPESVIEAFVVKIVVSKDGFDWYLHFDGDPDKPLYCWLQGKRKQTTKIMVSGGFSSPWITAPQAAINSRLAFGFVKINGKISQLGC